jgi:hypothetical protein
MSGQISTAKWLPTNDEQFQNPWLDVANFLAADVSVRPARFFGFVSLPNELKAYVAAFLPKESAIALALTCRIMYSLLGQRFFGNLTTREHWNLMLLLERDSELLVACQECMKLHSPFAPTPPCINQSKFLLPRSVTPPLCRLFAKRYIRQKPYDDLLSIVNRTQIHTLPDFKLFSNVTCHLSTGNLFVRQEISIAPLTAQGELTGRSAFLLHEIMDSQDSNLCPHVRWQHLGLELCCGPDSGNDYPSSLSAPYFRSQLVKYDYLRDSLYGNRMGIQLRKMDGQRIYEFGQDDRFATADPRGRCQSSR